MRTLILILLLIVPSANAFADNASLCGQRSDNYIAANQDKLAGKWLLEWTKGVVSTSAGPLAIEPLPPEMVFALSFEDDVLKFRGETFKRNFDVYWDANVIANFDAPGDDAAYAGVLDTLETENMFGCSIKDVPYLRGVSVGNGSSTGSKKGPQTDLHLWVHASEQMLGLSVAETGPAVARMMFVLTKIK